VKAVARDPGSRAKIAVIFARFLGRSGRRLRRHARLARAGGGERMQGEKIDIIPWSMDTATFVVNALAPAEVAKVVLDEDRQRIEVVVPDQQLRSRSDGAARRAARLAASPTGTSISTEQEESGAARPSSRSAPRSSWSAQRRRGGRAAARLRGVQLGRGLAFVDVKEIASIEGSTRTTAAELQTRAQDYLAQIEAELDAKRTETRRRGALKEIPASPPRCWSSSARTA